MDDLRLTPVMQALQNRLANECSQSVKVLMQVNSRWIFYMGRRLSPNRIHSWLKMIPEIDMGSVLVSYKINAGVIKGDMFDRKWGSLCSITSRYTPALLLLSLHYSYAL
jgi:hypothetical protein